MRTITHEFRSSCGMTFLITHNHTGYFSVRTKKNGDCQQCLTAVITDLMDLITDKKEVLKVISGVTCEKAKVGGNSCLDEMARIIKEMSKEEGK